MLSSSIHGSFLVVVAWLPCLYVRGERGGGWLCLLLTQLWRYQGFLGEHLGQFLCNSTRHSISKAFLHWYCAFFSLTICGLLTVVVGHKPQEAIWNAECNIRWRWHCSCPPLPHICAPQSELIWFSPLPLPSLSPKPGSNKSSPFILGHAPPFVHLPQHFYHRVISGEGHFTLCPTMGIKEGKTH